MKIINLLDMIGIVAAFLTALCFALNSVTLRRGVLTGYVYSSTILAVFLGIPMYLIALYFFSQPINSSVFKLAFILPFILVGILHFVVGRYIYYTSVHYAGTLISMPIMVMGQIFAAYLAIPILGEKITYMKLIGLLIATLGFISLSLLGFNRPDIKKSIILSLASAFIFASSTLIIRYGLTLLNHPILGILISYITALPFYLFLLLKKKIRIEISSIKKNILFYLIISAILVNSGQLLKYISLNIIEVTVAGPIISTEVILNLVLSSIINRRLEIVEIRTITGSIAVFVGILMILLRVP